MRSRARPRLFKSKFASGVPTENLLELLDAAYLFPAHRVDPAVAENSCIIYGRPERYFLGTLLNSKSHPRHHASDFAAMDLFLSRPLASTCSMPWSSSGWIGDNSSRSTLHSIDTSHASAISCNRGIKFEISTVTFSPIQFSKPCTIRVAINRVSQGLCVPKTLSALAGH